MSIILPSDADPSTVANWLHDLDTFEKSGLWSAVVKPQLERQRRENWELVRGHSSAIHSEQTILSNGALDALEPAIELWQLRKKLNDLAEKLTKHG